MIRVLNFSGCRNKHFRCLNIVSIRINERKLPLKEIEMKLNGVKYIFFYFQSIGNETNLIGKNKLSKNSIWKTFIYNRMFLLQR